MTEHRGCKREVPKMTEILMQHRTYIVTADQSNFMRELVKWSGAATPRELGLQVSQRDNSTRQTCKRRGWVTFDGHYWRITQAGLAALISATTKIDRKIRRGPMMWSN